MTDLIEVGDLLEWNILLFLHRMPKCFLHPLNQEVKRCWILSNNMHYALTTVQTKPSELNQNSENSQ